MPTILSDVLSDLGHGIANVRIRVQQVVVFLRLPVSECGQLLGNGLEKADNHANGSGLHVVAEFLDGSGVLRMRGYISN